MISGVVLGASLSPVIMAAMTMPVFAIVLWRTTLATTLLGPWTALRCRPEIRSLTRRAIIGSAAAGVVLAVHFATFVPSLTRTSVASAASLVAMQPVWSALLCRFLGEQIRRGVWVGIAIALAGVLGRARS